MVISGVSVVEGRPAAVGQFLPGPGEPVVPDVEGERGRLVEPAPHPLEQGVALLEDPVDVGADTVGMAVETDHRLVEPVAPSPRGRP